MAEEIKKKKRSSRERQIERLMLVVSSKGWIALWTLFVIVALFLFWSIFGIIPTEVDGRGIILGKNGNFVIEAPQSGLVKEILIEADDHISQGQLLMLLKNDQLEQQLENQGQSKDLVLSQKDVFSKDHIHRLVAEKQALETNIDNQQQVIQRLSGELDFLEKELQWKKQLQQKGVIALPSVHETMQAVNEKKTQRDSAVTSILNSESKLRQLNEILKFQDYQTRLSEVENKQKLLELSKQQLKIDAPFSGKVLSVPVASNEKVEKGEVLVWGQKDLGGPENMRIYGYFISKKEQRITPGMYAHIRLDDVDYKKYGDLIARVKEVWPFPVSSEEIYKLIGNRNLVNTITKGNETAPIQITLEPVIDKKTPSGFRWTSEEGPPFTLDTGTLGEVKVLLEARRPIEYVFPIFRAVRDSLTLTKRED